jgi:hypothetical protein
MYLAKLIRCTVKCGLLEGGRKGASEGHGGRATLPLIIARLPTPLSVTLLLHYLPHKQVKVKLSLCLIMHHAMKTYGPMGVCLHAFLPLSLSVARLYSHRIEW